jgi:formate hydrogenlyase transcriptional activator
LPRTLRTDARLIAAANRDLPAMVAAPTCRADLCSRGNVFPVHGPPLRERPDAIPLLVRDGAQPFARRRHNTIETIPAETMQACLPYPWPGNICDLQKILERAVLLSPGPVWQVPLTDRKPPATAVSPKHHHTLKEAERQHLRAAREEPHGVFGGPHGATIRLG